jgi:hypothetical protein
MALDSRAVFAVQPLKQQGAHLLERGDVSIVDEQRIAMPKWVRVFWCRRAHGSAAHMRHQRPAAQFERLCAVVGTFRCWAHLPEALCRAVLLAGQPPSVWIGEPAPVLSALINERVLRIEQLARCGSRMRGLESVQTAHDRFGIRTGINTQGSMREALWCGVTTRCACN